MDEHYWEEWDSLMEEKEEGRWIKWKDIRKERRNYLASSKMSAELTYLRGVINCALGGNYPSDIGCESHELNNQRGERNEKIINIERFEKMAGYV